MTISIFYLTISENDINIRNGKSHVSIVLGDQIYTARCDLIYHKALRRALLDFITRSLPTGV